MDDINFKPNLIKVGLFRIIALSLAIIFAFNVLLVLKPNEYANFILIFSFIQIISISILSWPNQYLLNYGRKSLSKAGNLNTILTARIIVHIILFICLVIIIIFLSPSLAEFLNLEIDVLKYSLIFGILTFPLVDIFTTYTQVYGKFFSYSISPIIQRFFQILALILLYYNFYDDWTILISFTIIGYFFSFMFLFIEAPKNDLLNFKFCKYELKNLFKYSSYIPISTISLLLFNWIDIWLIRFFFDEGSSGIFAWSYSFVLIANGLFTSLSIVIAPKVIDFTNKKNLKDRNKYYYNIISICLIFNLFLPLGLFLFNYILLNYLPYAFKDARLIILILISSIGFQFIFTFLEPIVYAKKNIVRKYSKLLVKMLIVKIALILIFFVNFDFIYISLATFLSYLYVVIKQSHLLNLKVISICKPCLGSIIIVNVFSVALIYFMINETNWFTYVMYFSYIILILILVKFRQLKFLPKLS